MGSNHKSQSDQNDEIIVFSIISPSTCSECGAELVKGSFLKMEKENPLFAASLLPPNESNANLVMGKLELHK
jgi:hypothetical protein